MKGLTVPVILVIDSDPLSMTGIAASLYARQYEVHCAGDCAAAMKAAETLALDLIICDTNLRGEDGIALVDRMHQLPDRADVPVMYLSSAQLPDVILRTHRHGSSYHLRKPFDSNLLIDLAEKALWMPHLVKSHINRPHIPLGNFAYPAATQPANFETYAS